MNIHLYIWSKYIYIHTQMWSVIGCKLVSYEISIHNVVYIIYSVWEPDKITYMALLMCF